MQLWRHHMPAGMRLKSDGKSSDLSDPEGALTLEKFCRTTGADYHRSLLPVKLETIVAYGLAFQQRFAPRVERKQLIRLERAGLCLGLHFDDGTWLTAEHVILAVGVLPFKSVPDAFAHLPPTLASHSSDIGALEPFDGREVAILGAGSSALDLAALLQARGTRVTLVTRAPGLVFHAPPAAHRDLVRRICAPDSKIGAGWLLRICDDAPQLVHALPGKLRRTIVDRTLGPSGGYFIRDHVVGKVAVRCGRSVVSAVERAGRLRLHLQDKYGNAEMLEQDHVILATGYQVDVGRLPFLAPDILTNLRTIGTAPALSANFESSVPGLHFVGYSSMASFGPVMRFIAGAPHPARRLAKHLATRRQPHRAAIPASAPG